MGFLNHTNLNVLKEEKKERETCNRRLSDSAELLHGTTMIYIQSLRKPVVQEIRLIEGSRATCVWRPPRVWALKSAAIPFCNYRVLCWQMVFNHLCKVLYHTWYFRAHNTSLLPLPSIPLASSSRHSRANEIVIVYPA